MARAFFSPIPFQFSIMVSAVALLMSTNCAENALTGAKRIAITTSAMLTSRLI